MNKNSNSGFTLIEILVVLAVLIITTAASVMVLPTVRQVWEKKVAPTLTPTPTPSPYLESCKAGEEPIYKEGVFVGCQEILPIEYPATPTVCQTDTDCPPSVGICIPGNCPGWVCQNKRCVYIEDMKAVPPAGTSSSVTWEETKGFILSGQVKEVYQSHSLLVTLVLKDRNRKTTTEPKIDIVFDVVRQCGQPCSNIISATE